MPFSIALNALFPEQHPEVWKQFRATVPNAPIVAHGINNSTELLPLRGVEAQRAYVRRTLDLIEKSTGVRSRGWSSPSVYPNADTFGPRPPKASAIRSTAWTPMSSPASDVGRDGWS